MRSEKYYWLEWSFVLTVFAGLSSHPAKIDLYKKWLPKQETIQNFNIDAQGFRKTRNENPPTQEVGVTG